MRKIVGSIAMAMMFALGASAHDFFINLSESMEHKPGSVGVSIGWGHAMPFDDFFMGNSLEVYEIYDPKMRKSALEFDKAGNEGIETRRYETKPSANFPEALIFGGDIFANKVYFTQDSARGVYQVAANTKKVQFSVWKDKKGRQKWGRVPLDEIKEAKEVKTSLNYQSFAKAYVSVGEWQNPKPIGHELELIPLSDLSRVKVGDEVEFEVLFLGKPLHEITDGMPPAIRAYGEQGGAGYVGAFVKAGKVKFRVHSSGRWTTTLSLRKKVSEEIAPELVGKALHKGYNASVTFFVRER